MIKGQLREDMHKRLQQRIPKLIWRSLHTGLWNELRDVLIRWLGKRR